VRKEGERLLARLPESERDQLRWEHVGSTSIKVPNQGIAELHENTGFTI
jgi:GrpB-like predicted nucleotidyltransferase (UPF0157 family)